VFDEIRLVRVLNVLIVSLLAIMVVMVFGNVVLRYGFRSGIPQSEELSRYAFVWLTFIAAVVGLRDGTHLGVDALVRNLPPAGRKVCRGASDVLMLVCCVLFAIGSYHQTVANVGRFAQASGFPLVVLFAVGLVASALMFALIAVDLFRLVTGRLSESRVVRIGSGE
jgi:TRAP-type C4-dicarboxylate transport system permease small subunit